MRGAGEQPIAEKTGDGDGGDQGDTGQAHRKRRAENQTREQGPRQGLGIQIQVGRESSHRPAGTNLTCRTSPNLKCDA